MDVDDNYIVLYGNTEVDSLKNYSDKHREFNFAQLPEEIKPYINGTGKGKLNIFYEPVGGINYIPYGAGKSVGTLIWYQTLKKIRTTPSNVDEPDGGKKHSRRKTRKNRRKY